MLPDNREDFKEFCLRKLGKPVIEINVDDEQVENRIDEALSYYWDYHFDGSEKTYYKYQVQEVDLINKYITLPENIIGAVSIFPMGATSVSSADFFNIRYQIAMNDLYNLTNVSMVPYFQVKQHLELLQELLIGKQPIRYSRHKNRLYIDMDWSNVSQGEWVVVEVYEVVDPDTYINVWKDRWLLEYTSALIEESWGRNLTKFTYMTLPGGIQFNGDEIMMRALERRLRLENEMITTYSLPVDFMIG